MVGSGIENAEIKQKPLLIIAPTGLLKNWEKEIDTHLNTDLGNLVRAFGSELKNIKRDANLDVQKLRDARWWNPAVEDQATDRIYRIGQKLPVHVHYPMATHTEFDSFDINLHKLLKLKRNLSSNVLIASSGDDAARKSLIKQTFKGFGGDEYDDGLSGQQFNRLYV